MTSVLIVLALLPWLIIGGALAVALWLVRSSAVENEDRSGEDLATQALLVFGAILLLLFGGLACAMLAHSRTLVAAYVLAEGAALALALGWLYSRASRMAL